MSSFNIPSGSGNFVPRSSPRKAGTCPTIDLDSLAEERKSFQWDSSKTKHFLEAMLEEIQSEGRGLLSFTQASWKRIIRNMFGRVGEMLTPKQCANRYTELKNYWKAWNLLELDRCLTGLGKDPDTGAITMPDHQWEQLIRRNKYVKRFRDRPLEHAQLMGHVFRKVTRRGKSVFTANADNPQQQDGSESTENQMEKSDANYADADPCLTPESEKGQPKLVTRSASSSCKRKGGSVSDAISVSINNLIDSCRQLKYQVMHQHIRQDNLERTTALLQDMKIFENDDNNELLWWAIHHFTVDPAKTSIFLGLKTPLRRIQWLQMEHSKAVQKFNQSGAPFGDDAPPLYFPSPPYE